MGEAHAARRVNLICGLLAGRTGWLEEARRRLEEAFGPVDAESEIRPFDSTDYYEREMGPDLLRQIVSFRDLIDPGDIAVVKHATNRMERDLAGDLHECPARPVNLDPGYIAPGKMVLATTKDYSHRIYVGEGIYAECTLRWRNKRFESWEWTYPDYCMEWCRRFLAQVRKLYKQKLAVQ